MQKLRVGDVQRGTVSREETRATEAHGGEWRWGGGRFRDGEGRGGQGTKQGEAPATASTALLIDKATDALIRTALEQSAVAGRLRAHLQARRELSPRERGEPVAGHA